MNEAIQNIRSFIDDICYVIDQITPIHTEEDVERIEKLLGTSDADHDVLEALEVEDLLDILSHCNPEDLISSLICIHAKNVNTASNLVRELEDVFTRNLLIIAESYLTPDKKSNAKLLKSNDTIWSFLKKLELIQLKSIDLINDFCVRYLRASKTSNYSLLINQAVNYHLGKLPEFEVTFLPKEESPYEEEKLTSEELAFLKDLIDYGTKSRLFQTNIDVLSHLLITKRATNNVRKVRFIGVKKRTEGYRLGQLLGLELNQMKTAFEFEDGVINKNNHPKPEYSTEFSNKIKELQSMHFCAIQSNRLKFEQEIL